MSFSVCHGLTHRSTESVVGTACPPAHAHNHLFTRYKQASSGGAGLIETRGRRPCRRVENSNEESDCGSLVRARVVQFGGWDEGLERPVDELYVSGGNDVA